MSSDDAARRGQDPVEGGEPVEERPETERPVPQTEPAEGKTDLGEDAGEPASREERRAVERE